VPAEWDSQGPEGGQEPNQEIETGMGLQALPADLSLRNPSVFLATWFGAGLLPVAPGTWGSLAALPFAWVIQSTWGWPGLGVAAGVVFCIGVWASGQVVARSGVDDHRAIVIDEVAGQWIVLMAAGPDFLLYGIGFVFFRAADILKPWPANWADRNIKGGLGVMVDDVIAAIYAGAALYGVSRVMA